VRVETLLDFEENDETVMIWWFGSKQMRTNA
jgi:hypothetical protein